ncbi:hypothetical protein Tco_1253473 [Tanacetum coccineum]
MKASREATRTLQQCGGSSEGAGATPEVPDEPTTDFVAKAKHDVMIEWGSGEESDKSNVNVDDIPWVSTNSDNGDQAMTAMEKNVAEKTEEEQGDEEQDEEAQDDDNQDQKDQADDDIIGTLVTMSQKEKPKVPRSSSSRSLLSNYGNQFLNLSSDASLVAPLLDVLVLVIPLPTTTTTTPLTTPLTTTLIPTPPIISTATSTTPIVPDLLPEVVQRVFALEKEISASEIMKVKQEQTAKEKVPKFSSTPYDQQADEEHKQKDILFKMMKSSKSGKDDMKIKMKTLMMEETVKKATYEVEIDVEEPTQENAENNADQPKSKDAPKTSKIPSKDWFKQLPRPPTPDPEWNTVQTINDEPEKTWFKDLMHAEKPPLTFDELMATPIDFSNSSIKLEYNMEECYKALTEKLDWENLKGDRCPFDLRKPLPLKGHPEIVARRDDQKLYKLKEGDFPHLHLNDIEEMLLLQVQHKLFNLEGSDIVDLAVALIMFTRRIIIQKGVKDV